MTDALPSVSERYRIERELGRGGMARVYVAHDSKHGRRVALKVVEPEIARAIGRERFLREIEIAARLNHPHVLALFDSGSEGETLYYVMPLIEGGSLRARLAREGQLPIEDALRLAHEVASALAHAHARGIVHRDIKPENILLSDGIALVADFGLARAVGAAADEQPSDDLTRTALVLGTPRYMSPEQASGGEIDARTDLYALACVLFEMLAGRAPFVAPTVDAQLRMHMTAEARPVTELRPDASRGVAAVIARGLSKAPAERHATAARFAEALAAAASGGDTGTEAHTARTLGPSASHNLKPRRTRFIGRERELGECAKLLGETRFLVLTGIGGCGKTRLALELAEHVLERFPDGVRLVDLAPLAEESRLAEAVAAPLGLREEPGRDLTEALCRHVQGQRMLLLLDNCEHLLSACAQLVDRLLGAGDELRILATSREGLGIEGERLYALRSLDVSDAAKLFMDRARAAQSDFVPRDADAAAVTEICRRLDGIPLAIELAAARVKLLSLDQIRARLDDRFRLLSGGSKTALPRHQTLRATIQWSYDLLAPEEQKLFRALTVFTGGFTLDGAVRVAGAGADEFEVMDLLARLVDKSLVLVERGTGAEPRYGLLETVRQYGKEHLAQAGEAPAVLTRHGAAFLDLAERAYADRLSREEQAAALLEAEHDNLRAALDFARGDSDPETYLRLAGALAWFWLIRSHQIEVREHLAAALATTPAAPPRPARARALWGVASLLTWQGDAAAEARRTMDEALRMWQELGDKLEIALALEGIGWSQLLGGEDEAARATFEECLRRQLERGDPPLVNRARVALAQVLVALGRVAEARPMASEIIAFSSAHADRRNEHFGWHFIADCALIEGSFEESLDLYRKSLGLAQAVGDRLEMSFEVQGVAMSLAALGDAHRGLVLAGATEAERERLGVDPHMRFWDALLERFLGGARRALEPDVADRAWGEGKRLPFDEAMSVALGEPRAGRA